jgi:hypothetical protein
VKAELFHADRWTDGQTDMTNLTIVFSSFATAPKVWSRKIIGNDNYEKMLKKKTKTALKHNQERIRVGDKKRRETISRDIKSGNYGHCDLTEVRRRNSFFEDSGIKSRSWPKFSLKKRGLKAT